MREVIVTRNCQIS